MKKIVFWSFIIFILTINVILISLFMKRNKTSYIQKDDVAFIYASTETEGNSALNIFDKNNDTRWESEWNLDPSWIVFEFKDKEKIAGVKISWEHAAALQYSIEISEDATAWRTVTFIDDGKAGEQRYIKFEPPIITQYFRINCIERSLKEYGYSIWEVEFNPVKLSPNNKLTLINAEASSSEENKDFDFSPSKVIDCDVRTRWSSEFSDPQWITVELADKQEIRAVKIIWESAAALKYEIQVAGQDKEWITAASINNGKPKEKRIITFKAVPAKFIRIYCTERTSEWGYSIWEIEVYK